MQTAKIQISIDKWTDVTGLRPYRTDGWVFVLNENNIVQCLHIPYDRYINEEITRKAAVELANETAAMLRSFGIEVTVEEPGSKDFRRSTATQEA